VAAILICCADTDLTRRWLDGVGAPGSVRCIRQLEEFGAVGGESTPSLALIDLEAPGIDGPEMAGKLCKRYPEIALMFFSRRPETAEGLMLIGAGGRAYCNCYIAPELLHKAVEVVALGEVWLGRRLVKHLLRNLGGQLPPMVDIDNAEARWSLTAREREVSLLVADGASNKGVARHLGITERTVKAHLSAIFRKTNTRDRLQLGLLVRAWTNERSAADEAGTKVQ